VPLPSSAVDAINPAFVHTKQQLLKPFRFGQWARLALVGLLAGEMSSGGGCNSSFNWPAPQQHKGSGHVVNAALALPLAYHPGWSAGLIISLVFAGIGLFLLFLYVSSVMRFILFDSVIAKECHIRKGWARHRSHGFQLFGWQILLTLATSAGILILIGIPLAGAWTLGWFNHPREHLLSLVLTGTFFLMLLFVCLLALGVVHVMTKDFVVPQMALENLSAMEGWRRLWSWSQAEKGSYAGYVGMKIVLAIGASVVLAIVSVIVFILLLIPIGGLGVIAVLSGATAGLTWNVFTITLAVFAGLIVFAMMMFVLSFISVPATVFFPAYSIYFLALRYAPLATLLWPQPGAAVTQASLPTEPPPWPPAPN
jgi:hypothetical protein